MATYNMGRFGVSRDQIRVKSALPDVTGAQQILIGGSFVQLHTRRQLYQALDPARAAGPRPPGLH